MLIEDRKLLDFEHSDSMVLVEMNMSDGIPTGLEVIWEDGNCIQLLD